MRRRGISVPNAVALRRGEAEPPPPPARLGGSAPLRAWGAPGGRFFRPLKNNRSAFTGKFPTLVMKKRRIWLSSACPWGETPVLPGGGGGAGHAALGYGRGRPPCPPGKGPECQGALFIREGEKPAREGALVTWEPPPPPPPWGRQCSGGPGWGERFSYCLRGGDFVDVAEEREV